VKRNYEALKYSIRILNNGDDSYTVEVPKLPGCFSSGSTKEECIANIIEAIELHLEDVDRKERPKEDVFPSIEVIQDAPSSDDYLISLPEACRFLDVSDSTLRRYVKDGRVPAYTFGKEYKFKLEELHQLVHDSRVTPSKKAASGKR